MTPTTNPKTGLPETHHEYYRLPVVHQKGLGRLRLDGQLSAVHTVPYRDHLTLDFYSRLKRSDELIVTFHGANDLTKNNYPTFARVRSLKNKAPAMMSFADPTMLLDEKREMFLSWYLGGPGWDPLSAILIAIRKAQGKCGAKHIAFLGGSGGGFAALRASSMVRGSMAFVQDPQTVLANYSPNVTGKYFSTAWPGWNKSSLIKAFPERFDIARHYRATQPENFVYYAQNGSDQTHVKNHLAPFKVACGITSENAVVRGRKRVINTYNGEFTGHGKITPSEFDHFYADAMQGWREYRSALTV